MTSRLCSAVLASACVLALAPAARHAQAAAFQLREDSAVGLGSAYAGAASAADTPATVFNNPAGMTQLPGVQVALGGSVIVPSFTFHGSATTVFGNPVPGRTDADGGHTAFVPHGYATYQLSPDISVGLAVTSPFGLETYYGPDFVGRYQADKTDLLNLNINPAVAWRVNRWLSLGAGVSADYARAEFATAINSESVLAAVLPPLALEALGPQPDGLFRLRGDDWGFGYNFGALLHPAPGTSIGLTYRSRIDHQYDGSVTFAVPPPLAAVPAFGNGPARAKETLPDSAAISITQAITPRLKAMADVTWTDWSLFRNLNTERADGTPLSSTPEHYHNSFAVAVGAAYQVNDRLTLRAGTAFDKTPVTDGYRTARVPDASRVWLAAGVSYRVLPRATVDFGYAHVFVDDARIDETSATQDVLQGRYTNHIDLVSLGTRLAF